MLISKFGIVKKEFIFTGKLKSSILAEYMSASDATFALYNNTSLNNRMCSPNKIFEAIHCKTFLITTNSFLTSEVVLENNIGVIVNDINAMNIYYAINSCLSKKNKQCEDNIWQVLMLKYCWESEFNRVKCNILIK